MRPLIFATRNGGKLKELRHLMPDLLVWTIDQAQAELGIAIADVIEDADTFVGNATKKAREVSALTGHPALADDSGLCVDALNGGPGVWSARYAGPGASDDANNAKLLNAMRDIKPPQRTAHFHCTLILADVQGRLGDAVLESNGQCHGVLQVVPRGKHGFGYDPLFLIPTLDKTLAELTIDEKSQLSHRAQAMQKMIPQLRAYWS
jgi:XTP/dITP diphosphohydrolase